MKFLLSLFLLSTFLITSCDRNPFLKVEGKISIDQELAAAADANANATSYADWHANDHHPEKVFAQMLTDVVGRKITADEICESLLGLNDDDLVLFEDELGKEENKVAVEPCHQELRKKIKSYWATQRKYIKLTEEMKPQTEPKLFKTTEVILRDVSNGYYTSAGELHPKQVLLTFDDGPHPTNTQKVLAALKKANVRAIFFAMGQNVRRYPHLTQSVADAGHSVGSHSYTHSCLPAKRLCKRSNGGHILSAKEAIAEIRGGHQAVYNVLGWVDPFFRFPYGESSSELKSYLRTMSAGEFYWSIDSNDWRARLPGGRANTPATIIESVLKQLKQGGGRGIVLFHDVQTRTAEALPAFLKRLAEEGYQPVIFQAKDPEARFHSKLVDPRGPKS